MPRGCTCNVLFNSRKNIQWIKKEINVYSAGESIRNRREEGRAVENAKCSATVETADLDRPKGSPCRLMLPGPREARLQSVRDNQAQRLWILMLPGRPDSSL